MDLNCVGISVVTPAGPRGRLGVDRLKIKINGVERLNNQSKKTLEQFLRENTIARQTRWKKNPISTL